MASKKKTTKKAPAKKKAASKKKAAPKKNAAPSKKAAPRKTAKPKTSKAEEKIIEELKGTVEEVRVVMSKKQDVLSNLAKDVLEEKLNEQAAQQKVGFFKKIFGFKK